jgi:hypothetical protein
LTPSISSTNLACTPRIYIMGTLSMTLCPLHPKRTRITRNPWLTGSTCFTAVLMQPPTPPSASTPALPLQSVAAFSLWHKGDLYNDWSVAILATSDNAKLQAITDGICQAYNVGLEDVYQVHVFSDSANTLCLTMDTSHHSGQHLSLSICKVLVPWL